MAAIKMLIREGGILSEAVNRGEWNVYLDGGNYTDAQREALVDALMVAQREEFDALLPDGCWWSPSLSEIQGPAGTDLSDFDLTEMMEQAAKDVDARFGEIETATLGES